MRIVFANNKLRRLCEQRGAAERTLGKAGAQKLRTRLAELRAAQNVSELIAGNPHPLRGEYSDLFALRLDGGRRIVFAALLQDAPWMEIRSIDWSRVTAVQIEFIGDYHD